MRSETLSKPSPVLFQPSDELRRKYEIINKLNEGVYGVVLRARHRKTGKYRALKRVKSHKSRSGFPTHALREIRALQTMQNQCTNIVHLYGVCISTLSSVPSVFLEFNLLRTDLAELCRLGIRWKLPQIKCIFRQISHGISFMHSRRLVHRDLKLANVLISDEGCVQICDFGLTKSVSLIKYEERERSVSNDGTSADTTAENENRHHSDDERRMSNCVVTLWYRAPEILLGDRYYSLKSDVWSLGCLMAELLNGAVLCKGKGELEQLKLILELVGKGNESYLEQTAHYQGFNSELSCAVKSSLSERFPIDTPIALFRGEVSKSVLEQTHFGKMEDESEDDEEEVDSSHTSADASEFAEVIKPELQMPVTKVDLSKCDSQGFEIIAKGPTLSQCGFELLSSLLALNPLVRVNSNRIANHEWFNQEPLPCEPSELRIFSLFSTEESRE